jgi:hypothetical protein
MKVGGRMATDSRRRTFISYSRTNEAFAVKLATELKISGYSVWLDQLDIPTGARWDDEIEKALRECGIFLAILTPAFIASENAKDEIGYAIDHGKRILPVLLQECEIPFRLRRFQYIDFTRMNYSEGVRHAKEMLAKLVNEESIPSLTNITKNETYVRDEVDKHRNGERPTRPRKGQLLQSDSNHPHGEPIVAGIPKKSPFKRTNIISGIAVFAIIISIVGLSLGFQLFSLLPLTKQTPTSTPTHEIRPSATPSPTVIPATNTPTLIPDLSFTEEFDSSTGWEENWSRSVIHGNERDIQFLIENGEANWLLNDRYLSVYYFYKKVFNYNDTSVQLNIRFKNLAFLNTNIDDPEISYLGLICGYKDEGWYEINFNGGKYKIIRRAGYQQTKSVPRDAGIKGWKSGDGINDVTVVCKSDGITISANEGEPISYMFGRDEVKLSEGQVGIALTSDKDFPVRIKLLSITVSDPNSPDPD